MRHYQTIVSLEKTYTTKQNQTKTKHYETWSLTEYWNVWNDWPFLFLYLPSFTHLSLSFLVSILSPPWWQKNVKKASSENSKVPLATSCCPCSPWLDSKKMTTHSVFCSPKKARHQEKRVPLTCLSSFLSLLLLLLLFLFLFSFNYLSECCSLFFLSSRDDHYKTRHKKKKK